VAYRYPQPRSDLSDLAGGFVLHSAPGFPAFPVRLAGEMLRRALALRGRQGSVAVWDPCCGSGYLLTALALVHRPLVSAVLASDLDDDAVGLAARNLALLCRDGLAARERQLCERAELHGRPSHAAAAAAAARLAAELAAGGGDVLHAAVRADALDPAALAEALATVPRGLRPDVVLTDVPYGEQTNWLGPFGGDGVAGLLAALARVLPADAVLALAARGRRFPPNTQRATVSFRIGTRVVALHTAGQLRQDL